MERIEIRHYPVVGSRRADLLASMALTAPLRDGARHAAFTAWRVSWRFDLAEAGGAAALAAPRVELAARLVLPRWRPPPGVAAPLVGEWRRYVAALQAHEEEHLTIARAARAEVAAALTALPPASARAELLAGAEHAARAALARAREAERELDRRSDHGRRDGARFLEV